MEPKMELLDKIETALTDAETELMYAQTLQPDNLPELAETLLTVGRLGEQLKARLACPHEHVMVTGGLRFFGGDVYDDLNHICAECGAEVGA